VAGRHSEHVPCGVKRQASDRLAEVETQDALGGGRVPQPDLVVQRPAGEHVRVPRMEAHHPRRAAVAGERA